MQAEGCKSNKARVTFLSSPLVIVCPFPHNTTCFLLRANSSDKLPTLYALILFHKTGLLGSFIFMVCKQHVSHMNIVFCS
jgi:hypothetical protein